VKSLIFLNFTAEHAESAEASGNTASIETVLKDVKRAIKDLEKPVGAVWGEFAEYECVRDWLNCCTQRHSRLYGVIAVSCRIVRYDPISMDAKLAVQHKV
jgi:hypothetical protein